MEIPSTQIYLDNKTSTFNKEMVPVKVAIFTLALAAIITNIKNNSLMKNIKTKLMKMVK